MNVEFRNIRPGEDYDAARFLEIYGQDTLTVVSGIFAGDIHIDTRQFKLVLPRVEFIDFSRRLFVTAFQMNFHSMTENTITLDTPDERGELRVLLSNAKIILIFRLGASRTLEVNGQIYRSGDDMTFVVDLLFFSRLCGMMYGKSIDFLEERFDGLDGIKEYFGLIPFYEGFDEDLL
jgi:hypothetical protein